MEPHNLLSSTTQNIRSLYRPSIFHLPPSSIGIEHPFMSSPVRAISIQQPTSHLLWDYIDCYKDKQPDFAEHRETAYLVFLFNYVSLQEIRNWKTGKGWEEYGIVRDVGLRLAQDIKTFLSLKEELLQSKL